MSEVFSMSRGRSAAQSARSCPSRAERYTGDHPPAAFPATSPRLASSKQNDAGAPATHHTSVFVRSIPTRRPRPPPMEASSHLPPPSAPDQPLSETASSTSHKSTGAALEGWRSVTVDLEASLKTINFQFSGPSSERLTRVIGLLDALVQCSPNLATILRLFRSEFILASYCPVESQSNDDDSHFTGTSASDVADARTMRLGTPFFDLVAVLKREKAILSAELDVIEAESTVEDLKRQVGKLQSLIPFYEGEITRLAKDNKDATEELQRLKQSTDYAAQQHHTAFNALDEYAEALSRTNKELEDEIKRLRKVEDAFGGQALDTAYTNMKHAKMELLHDMYERGNEEASLLLLAHQIESATNKTLSRFDREYAVSDRGGAPSIRAHLIRSTSLLLEEMHEIEERRARLYRDPVEAPRSTIASLKASLIKQSGAGAGDSGTGAGSVPSSPRSASRQREEKPTCTAITASASLHHHRRDSITVANMGDASQRAAWVSAMFADLSNQGIMRNALTPVAHADPSNVFSKRVTAPLADVSASKFMSGVEVFALQAPGEPEYVQSVPHMDPLHSIQLPPKSTHVRIKFMQPMRKELRVKFGQHEFGKRSLLGVGSLPAPSIQGTIVNRRQIMDWLQEKLEGQQSEHDSSTLGNSSASPVVPGHPPQQDARSQPHALSTMTGDHWSFYKEIFGVYTPYLPRLLPIAQIDVLMLNAFRGLNVKIESRYEACLEDASSRCASMQTAKLVAERTFREKYKPHDLQHALLSVLEAWYVFPELTAKVLYEVLSSIEVHAERPGSHCGVFLDCLAGKTAPAHGHLLALIMHSIACAWPGSDSAAGGGTGTEDPLSQKEVPPFLRLVYPPEGVAFHFPSLLDDMVSELLLATRPSATRPAVRQFFASIFTGQNEPITGKFLDLLVKKTHSIQWTELDFHDFCNVFSPYLKDPNASFSRHQYACCVMNKTNRLPPRDMTFVAVLTLFEQAYASHPMPGVI